MDPEAPRVRIPADIDMEDHLLGRLTARQLLILAAAGITVWAAYATLGRLLPLPVFAPVVIVIIAVAVMLALGRADGLSLDRLLAAAVMQARAPHRLVPAPDGIARPAGFVDPDATAAATAALPSPLRLPGVRVSPEGIIDLGADGHAVLLACTTVSFALRTPAEQEAVTAGYAAWLNSLPGPAQILVRAERIDLSPRVQALREAAPGLPHPALEAAARAHAGFLEELSAGRDLLAHDVLLVLREPATVAGRRIPGEQATRRLLRHADHAGRALRAAGVLAHQLPGPAVLAALAASADPDAPARTTDTGAGSTCHSGLAAPTDVITTAGTPFSA